MKTRKWSQEQIDAVIECLNASYEWKKREQLTDSQRYEWKEGCRLRSNFIVGYKLWERKDVVFGRACHMSFQK